MVRPLQSPRPRIREGGQDPGRQGVVHQAGQSRRHRGTGTGRGARRPRLSHAQVLQERQPD